MKLSEVIEQLTILQSKYGGDLPVYFDDESHGEQEVGKFIHLPERPPTSEPLDFPGFPERILIQDEYA